MGLFDAIRNEFIQIIEWLDESSNTLVYRFPVHEQEIKMGAQLTVRENQVALFINEGEVADLFKPGRYELSTQNMPVMTTLRSWKYGFDSPFKAEVYFFNTRLFTDLKWGTSNPVMMRDAEFGMIRMRAFGTYANGTLPGIEMPGYYHSVPPGQKVGPTPVTRALYSPAHMTT